ncbi:MAG: molybdopterin-dependent oxidoreductase [Candidatus Promineifilaceae bacterium]|nr:molybdopterin-dependent oxidoreductase [Candidatus Promineifilaceae bacterium]
MKSPWSNIALLFILVILTVTGYLGLVSGYEHAAWRLWLHGIAAYALFFLFIWKSSIILDAYRRKNQWTRQRLIFAVLLTMLLLTALLGLVWTLDGPRYWAGFSYVSLHIYLAIPVMLIMLWHAWRMRFIFRVKGALERRLFLRVMATAAAGFLFWRTAESGKKALAWDGARRRFTGSYEQGSHSGYFPATSWLFDNPRPVDLDAWRLEVRGLVKRPTTLNYEQLLGLPPTTREVLLDCTSGWYTVQEWQGVLVADLLRKLELNGEAASITVQSISGYKRRFPIAQAGQMLLATHVAGQPLSHAHGAPLRLVIDGRRGYDWVKWVGFLQVNGTNAIWQSPLPLR